MSEMSRDLLAEPNAEAAVTREVTEGGENQVCVQDAQIKNLIHK